MRWIFCVTSTGTSQLPVVTATVGVARIHEWLKAKPMLSVPKSMKLYSSFADQLVQKACSMPAPTIQPDRVLLPVKVATPALKKSDRKSTRLNSSHLGISYAVFCLKKKSNNI